MMALHMALQRRNRAAGSARSRSITTAPYEPDREPSIEFRVLLLADQRSKFSQ
jgi:hypothetical protein